MFKDKDSAAIVVDLFYEKTPSSQYEEVKPLLHEAWLEKMPENTSINFLKKFDNTLGKIESKKMIDFGVHYQKNLGKGSGTYLTLIYNVTRSEDTSVEIFKVYRPEKEEKFYILGYDVNSQRLMDALVQ